MFPGCSFQCFTHHLRRGQPETLTATALRPTPSSVCVCGQRGFEGGHFSTHKKSQGAIVRPYTANQGGRGLALPLRGLGFANFEAFLGFFITFITLKTPKFSSLAPTGARDCCLGFRFVLTGAPGRADYCSIDGTKKPRCEFFKILSVIFCWNSLGRAYYYLSRRYL